MSSLEQDGFEIIPDVISQKTILSVGESLGDGDARALGVGVGLVADAAVQPVRTITMPLAPTSRAVRKAMVMQRCSSPRRAPRIAASGVEKAA